MAAIGGSPLECVWRSLLFIQLCFKAALLLGSLWVELWPWCHSMEGQTDLTIVIGHLFRYTQWLSELTHNAVPCWCANCGLAGSWEWSMGAFYCWLESATWTLLMPSLKIQLLHMSLSCLKKEDAVKQKGERGQLSSWNECCWFILSYRNIQKLLVGKKTIWGSKNQC